MCRFLNNMYVMVKSPYCCSDIYYDSRLVYLSSVFELALYVFVFSNKYKVHLGSTVLNAEGCL